MYTFVCVRMCNTWMHIDLIVRIYAWTFMQHTVGCKSIPLHASMYMFV